MCLSSFSSLTRTAADRPPTYIVTGLLHSGKRFRLTTTSRMHAFGINLWRGTVWIVENNKRRAIKRVVN